MNPLESFAHKWKYSQVKKTVSQQYMCLSEGLYLIGDYFFGSFISDAFLSSEFLYDTLNKEGEFK